MSRGIIVGRLIRKRVQQRGCKAHVLVEIELPLPVDPYEVEDTGEYLRAWSDFASGVHWMLPQGGDVTLQVTPPPKVFRDEIATAPPAETGESVTPTATGEDTSDDGSDGRSDAGESGEEVN